MSYTTRCPACGTTFKVVPDQLKISDGWVRCGHCADVFDATLYLEAWVPPAPVAPPEPVLEAVAESVVERQPEVAPAPGAQQMLAEPEPEPEPEPVLGVDAPTEDIGPVREFPDGEWLVEPAKATPPEPEAPATEELPAPPSTPADATEDFHTELARFAAQSGHPVVETVSEPPITPDALPAFTEPEPTQEETSEESVAEEPGFVRQARRQAFWRSPGVRTALLLLTFLLTVLLALQWTVHTRDRLAARHPELAPLLARLCAPLGCEITAPREIEAVVIDSSTLVRRLGSFYAFDVVLKNTADMAVAVPALEFSLTDTRDQVIARRVFLPSELPGAPAQLPAHESVSLSLRLNINDAGPLGMAGYRALVFYP